MDTDVIDTTCLVCALNKLTKFTTDSQTLADEIYDYLHNEIVMPSDGHIELRDLVHERTGYKATLSFNEATNLVMYASLYAPTTEASRKYIINRMRSKCILRAPESSHKKKWLLDIKRKQENRLSALHFCESTHEEAKSYQPILKSKSCDTATSSRWDKISQYVKNGVVRRKALSHGAVAVTPTLLGATRAGESSRKVGPIDTNLVNSDMGGVGGLEGLPSTGRSNILSGGNSMQLDSRYAENSKSSPKQSFDMTLDSTSILRSVSVDTGSSIAANAGRICSATVSECGSTSPRWDSIADQAKNVLECCSADSSDDPTPLAMRPTLSDSDDSVLRDIARAAIRTTPSYHMSDTTLPEPQKSSPRNSMLCQKSLFFPSPQEASPDDVLSP
jgi:hypothetical protein